MVTCMLGMSFIFGLNSALETLVSQAHGSKNKQLYAIYLQRGRVALLLIYGPILVVFLLSKQLLLLAGQNEAVVAQAYMYLLARLPGQFLYGWYDLQRKFLT